MKFSKDKYQVLLLRRAPCSDTGWRAALLRRILGFWQMAISAQAASMPWQRRRIVSTETQLVGQVKRFSPLSSAPASSPASSFGSPDRGKRTIIWSEFSRGPPNWLGGGALELLREAEIVGLVQAGEEMALEETQQQPTSITYGQATKKSARLFTVVRNGKMKCNWHNLKLERFRLDIKRNFFSALIAGPSVNRKLDYRGSFLPKLSCDSWKNYLQPTYNRHISHTPTV